MGIVVFDPAAFVTRYPEFSAISSFVLTEYFMEATIYLDNTDASRVSDVAQRTVLLNMLTAHVAAINGSETTLVGRISYAGEGTVAANTMYTNNPSESMAFFTQTKYGAAFWAATRSYRTMVYRNTAPLRTWPRW